MLGALVTLVAVLLGGPAPRPPAPPPVPEPVVAPPAKIPSPAPQEPQEPRETLPEIDDPVERWRPIVEASGLPVKWALKTMRCESRGDPHAVNPRGPYVGLMQIYRGSKDPETNLAQAASIYQRQGRRAWPVCGR